MALRHGSFSTGRDALERACAFRVACTPQSSKRIGFSRCVRFFYYYWLRPLLRGRRETARVDELDPSRHRPGFANLVADPHLFRKREHALRNQLLERSRALRLGGVEDRHPKSRYYGSQRSTS